MRCVVHTLIGASASQIYRVYFCHPDFISSRPMSSDETQQLIRLCLSDRDDEKTWSVLDERVTELSRDARAAHDLGPAYEKDLSERIRRQVRRELHDLDPKTPFANWVGAILDRCIDDILRIRKLVATCKSGQGDHHEWADVFAYALHIARPQIAQIFSEADQKEIEQDVCLSVFKSLKQFRGDSPFSHWIGAITSHRIVDYLRKSKRRSRGQVQFGTDEEAERFFNNLASDSLNAFESLALGEQMRRHEQALADIPEECTKVILLSDQGLSAHEIAKELELPIAKVYRLRSIAKRLYHIRLLQDPAD